MLSTSMLAAPVSTFAAETQSEQGTKAIDRATFEQDLMRAMTYIPPIIQPNGTGKIYNPFHYSNPAIINLAFSLEDFKDVTATESKDITTADDMQEATYENVTDLNQTHVTPSKTITNTDSFTYSNTEGAKLGVELAHTFNVNVSIPGVGGTGGSTTEKVSTEFSYNHTSSNTTSHTEQITIPSQTIVAAPHGTTHYLGKVQRVEFSGTTENTGYITGTIEAETNFLKATENGPGTGPYDYTQNGKDTVKDRD
ncbi:ETX/MTX2 family pore-forming toxin [Bacillus sp. FSL K6-0268]|uniref:ETX/MTX2 family pore-forming toxin n=1 Tax=Bacillus sp. FSL K6-0268 TaxID=2921449 RepID=UPI0030F608B9